MKIDDYALLLKLNEIGTIHGTVKIILISQPVVLQRRKYMEKYFGEKIFIRTSKKLILTPSGEVIIKHAKKSLRKKECYKIC